MDTTIINLAVPVGDANRIIHIDGYQAESYSETPSRPIFQSEEIGGRSSPIVYYQGGEARTVSFSMVFHRDIVAPWSSTVYGGQPAGIDNFAMQGTYGGLYLGQDSQGKTSEELLERFKNDVHNWFVEHHEDLNLPVDYDIDYNKAWTEHNIEAEAEATGRFHVFLNKLKALNYPVYSPNGIIPPRVYLKIGGDSNGFGGIKLKGYADVSVNYDGLTKYNSLISATVDFSFTEVVDIAWSASEVANGMQRYVEYMESEFR